MTNLPTDPKSMTHWGEFLEWVKADYPKSTLPGGMYARRAENGMDASEDMSYLPTDHNYWIWWVRYRETLSNNNGSRNQEASDVQ